MSFRTAWLAAIDNIRAIAGPTGFDIRVNQLTIRRRTWSGGRISLGSATDVDLVLPARYPIRYLNAQELNSPAGSYEIGDILVDHITPSDGAGAGYTQEQLTPTVTTNGVEIIYVITGTHAGEYTIVDCRTYRPFTSQLVLRRRASTP
jgi:hypothetical protein